MYLDKQTIQKHLSVIQSHSREGKAKSLDFPQERLRTSVRPGARGESASPDFMQRPSQQLHVKPLIAPRPALLVSCVNPVQKPTKEDKIPYYGRALYEFAAETDEEISLYKGDIVEVTYKSDDWLYVNHNGEYGYVPSTYIIRHEEDEQTDVREQCIRQTVGGNAEGTKAVYANTGDCQRIRQRISESDGEVVLPTSMTPLSNEVSVPVIPPRQSNVDKDSEILLPRRKVEKRAKIVDTSKQSANLPRIDQSKTDTNVTYQRGQDKSELEKDTAAYRPFSWKVETNKDEERGYVEIVQGKETLEKIAQHVRRKAVKELRLPRDTNEKEQDPVNRRIQNLKTSDQLDVRPKVFSVQQRTVYPAMQLGSMADTLELSNAIGLVEVCKLNGSVEYGTGIRLDGNLMLTRLKPLQELFETSATLSKKEKEQLYKRSTKVLFGQNESFLISASVKPGATFTMVEEDVSIVELKGKIVRNKVALASPKTTEDDWIRDYPFVLGYNHLTNIACHFCSFEKAENEDMSKWLIIRTTRLSSKSFGSPVLFVKDNNLEIIAIVIGRYKKPKPQELDQRILDDCFKCLKLSFLMKQLKFYNPTLLNNIS